MRLNDIPTFSHRGLHENGRRAAGLRTEIDGISVSVNVERENQRAAGKRVAVGGSPLIDELPSPASRVATAIPSRRRVPFAFP